MNEFVPPTSSRRTFLQQTGRLAAASALAATTIPHVHAAENNTLSVALIGCGGRGTGAAANALSVKNGPIKLVAMADVFEDRLARSSANLKRQFGDKVDVPQERQFVGFDGYRKAMDCLPAGGVAIFASPPAFRWVHFGYAIGKGLNVFMEKPITVDGPSTRKLLQLAEESEKRNLKVGVGLMCRHCKARQELFRRIKDGQIGDLIALRAYRLVGPAGFTGPKPEGTSELFYQVRRFHSFLWASGGVFMDFLIHNIDESCWMKDAWPVQAQGSGGRQYRGKAVDQNFDHYAIEYTFADGTKLFVGARNMRDCHQEFASYAHGTKGSAVISTLVHTPAKCRIYKGHNIRPYNENPSNLLWKFPPREPNPYQLEWDDLIEAIRQDKPYNEARRGAEASLVTAMGRMACHTGNVVTYDQILNCEHEFAPEVAKLTMTSSAPLLLDKDGKYPCPQPGILARREY
jgi:predicted dehydrogenase